MPSHPTTTSPTTTASYTNRVKTLGSLLSSFSNLLVHLVQPRLFVFSVFGSLSRPASPCTSAAPPRTAASFSLPICFSSAPLRKRSLFQSALCTPCPPGACPSSTSATAWRRLLVWHRRGATRPRRSRASTVDAIRRSRPTSTFCQLVRSSVSTSAVSTYKPSTESHWAE